MFNWEIIISRLTLQLVWLSGVGVIFTFLIAYISLILVNKIFEKRFTFLFKRLPWAISLSWAISVVYLSKIIIKSSLPCMVPKRIQGNTWGGMSHQTFILWIVSVFHLKHVLRIKKQYWFWLMLYEFFLAIFSGERKKNCSCKLDRTEPYFSTLKWCYLCIYSLIKTLYVDFNLL